MQLERPVIQYHGCAPECSDPNGGCAVLGCGRYRSVISSHPLTMYVLATKTVRPPADLTSSDLAILDRFPRASITLMHEGERGSIYFVTGEACHYVVKAGDRVMRAGSYVMAEALIAAE